MKTDLRDRPPAISRKLEAHLIGATAFTANILDSCSGVQLLRVTTGGYAFTRFHVV
jgi:hypothetical protein